jgi:hypothetical protein
MPCRTCLRNGTSIIVELTGEMELVACWTNFLLVMPAAQYYMLDSQTIKKF